jgi:hypothetical protein
VKRTDGRTVVYHNSSRLKDGRKEKGTLDSQPQVIVYQVLVHGRWLSPASSTTQTGRHDIAEILLKVVLNTKIKSNQIRYRRNYSSV